MGDLALLFQNLEIARGQGRRAFVRRWSALPSEVEAQVAEAGGTIVDGRNPAALLRVARRSDIVIGGGQLVRENVSLASLISLLAAALATKAGGGRVTTRGLGVSPIGKGLRRRLWGAVLALTDDVRVRDEASLRHAKAIAPSARVIRTADMAFHPSRLHDHAENASASTRTILVAPCIDESEGRTLDGPAFPELLRAAQRRFPDAELVFACHDARASMDVAAADLLMRRHGLTGRKSAAHDLRAFLADYASAEIVVTNRLHSVIFSILGDRPVLAVNDGSPKIEAVAEAFAIPTVGVAATGGADAAVERAVRFNTAARRAAREAAATAARRNLEDETLS